MSHDTDKLIRQLSLVAFLMAERRAAHRARRQGERRGLLGDVRRGVRPALLLGPRRAARARRPARLAARRVHRRGAVQPPLRALLPPASSSLDGRELAALQTLYLLEGTFAYAEPLRLALQNLASAGPASSRRRRRRLIAWIAKPTTRPRRRAGSRSSRADLEAAHGQVRATTRSRATRSASARSIPTPAAGRRPLVRDRPGSRPRRHSGRSGSRGSAATSGSRPGASATSGSRGLRRRGLPRPRRLADRRHSARRGWSRWRHGVVGRAGLRPCRPPRGRRVRHEYASLELARRAGSFARTAAQSRSPPAAAQEGEARARGSP